MTKSNLTTMNVRELNIHEMKKQNGGSGLPTPFFIIYAIAHPIATIKHFFSR